MLVGTESGDATVLETGGNDGWTLGTYLTSMNLKVVKTADFLYILLQ